MFPARSINSKVNDPLLVNVYPDNQPLLVMVTHVSLNPVRVAITLPVVANEGTYSIVAVGFILSIHVTVAIASPVLNPSSLKVKVKVPFPVNVYQVNQPLLVMVTHVSLNHVSIATTFQLVNVDGIYSIVAVGFVTSLNIR